ncbi:MAG: hypothetical protein V4764_02750 [Burkholderia sp.]
MLRRTSKPNWRSSPAAPTDMPTTAITPKDLITRALKRANVLGVGQTAQAEDVKDAFYELVSMLAEWQTDRYLVYQTIDVAAPSTGKQSYTVGPGGDFDVPRPSRIEQAFARQMAAGTQSEVDYPLATLFAREDYDRIRMKGLGSWPQMFYYDRGFPLGNLFVWPIPNSTFELHLTVMQELQQFTNPAEQINMPPIYARAIEYNLSVLLYPMYGLQPDQVVVVTAKRLLNRLRGTNAEIPQLTIGGGGTGGPNIFNPYGGGGF